MRRAPAQGNTAGYPCLRGGIVERYIAPFLVELRVSEPQELHAPPIAIDPAGPTCLSISLTRSILSLGLWLDIVVSEACCRLVTRLLVLPYWWGMGRYCLEVLGS